MSEWRTLKRHIGDDTQIPVIYWGTENHERKIYRTTAGQAAHVPFCKILGHQTREEGKPELTRRGS